MPYSTKPVEVPRCKKIEEIRLPPRPHLANFEKLPDFVQLTVFGIVQSEKLIFVFRQLAQEMREETLPQPFECQNNLLRNLIARQCEPPSLLQYLETIARAPTHCLREAELDALEDAYQFVYEFSKERAFSQDLLRHVAQKYKLISNIRESKEKIACV
jgi:hypothetical protein